MGTLGKVLLFVNLLAAAGLTYLAAQDWARRQEVTAVALRHHLALKGLPVAGTAAGADSDVTLDLELSGGQTADTVRRSLLTSHFQGGDGGGNFGDPAAPVSQLAELGRVKAKLEAVLSGLGSPAERLAYLCGTLAPDRAGRPAFTPGLLARLANTYDERAAVVNLVTAAGQNVEDSVTRAKALLDTKFAAAEKIDAKQAEADATTVKELSDAARKASADAQAAFDAWQQNLQDPMALQAADAAIKGLRAAQDKQTENLQTLGGTASRDATDQRRRIARLLGEVDPAAGWQKRVALVVGLRTYKEAVGEQVDRLRDMARSAQAQAVSDQAEFTETYLLLKQQASARTLVLAQQQLLTADLLAQQAKEREATALRRAQFVTRQADLAAVRKDVAEALARQAEVEVELFAVQKKVGDTLRLNFDLEDQLQKAEYKAQGK